VAPSARPGQWRAAAAMAVVAMEEEWGEGFARPAAAMMATVARELAEAREVAVAMWVVALAAARVAAARLAPARAAEEGRVCLGR